MTRPDDGSDAGARPFGNRDGGPRPPPPPARRKRRRGRVLNAIIALLVVAVVSGVGAAGVWIFYDLPATPDEQTLWTTAREPGITFEDVNGEILATRGARNGRRVRLSDLPPYVPNAFLAAEDRRFYSHGPIEVRSILRAALRNARVDGPDQGGSTLTQQIAKTLFLTPDQTLKRKLQEAVIAWRLEQRMSKDELLELYLNRVYFGARSYGIDAASLAYFGHSASTLTIGEAALLAALPKAPSRLALNRNLPAALERSRSVLATMRQEGWISPDEEQLALVAPPSLAPPPSGDGDFGYVLDFAAAEATAIAGENAPDIIVRLTIDPKLQRIAQGIVADTVASEGRAAGATQAALIAMTPNGAIRAVVGGVDHGQSPFNRATQARRQPGSSFKPIIYAAALERGISPLDVRVDSPVRVGTWRPQNYGGGYAGAMTVERALAQSINTIAVKLALEVGRDKIGEVAHRFGLSEIPDAPEYSVALGAYEVSLRDLTSAFQVFQNGGARYPSYVIETITTSSGETIYQHVTGAGAPAYDVSRSGQMVRMMEGVIVRGTGRGADFGRPAAGKTGTSQDWRDAWFVGFTPDWAAGVWAGNDDNSQMSRVTGGSLPADIWRRFMIAAHEGTPPHDFDFIGEYDAPGQDEPVADPLDADTPLGEVVIDRATLEPPASPQEKSDFYDSLADDFARP